MNTNLNLENMSEKEFTHSIIQVLTAIREVQNISNDNNELSQCMSDHGYSNIDPMLSLLIKKCATFH